MEYYFNEDLLYLFIYKYYPFKNITHHLIQNGAALVQIILRDLIQAHKELWNLKEYSIQSITELVIQQFSYKFPNISYCYGAFGNFYFHSLSKDLRLILEQELKNPKKSYKINLLKLQEINNISDPLKSRLQQISCVIEKTNQLPIINKQDIQKKKLLFLQTYVDLKMNNDTQNLKRKGKKKKTNKKQFLFSLKNLKKNESLIFDKIQEERNTEVDEYEGQISNQVSDRNSSKKSYKVEKQSINQKISVKIIQEIDSEKLKSDLNQIDMILRYDEMMAEKKRVKQRSKKRQK